MEADESKSWASYMHVCLRVKISFVALSGLAHDLQAHSVRGSSTRVEQYAENSELVQDLDVHR